MSLVALPFPVVLMPPGAMTLAALATAVGSPSGLTFNGASDKVAWVFQAQSTTPPNAIRFNVSSFTTGGTVDATLETVATDGTPSGTLVSGSATVSKSVTATGFQETAAGMAGSASLTVGTEYAIVLTAAAGFAGNFVLPVRYGTTAGIGLPYGLTKDSAGGWTKVSTAEAGYDIGAIDSGGNVLPLLGVVGPYTAYAFVTYSNSSNPDEYGNRFVPAAPMRIIGACYHYTGGSAPGTADAHTVKLLSSVSSGGSPTEERTYVAGGGVQAGNSLHMCMFPSTYDAVAGASLGMTLKADSTDNASLIRYTFNSNADLAAFCGINCHQISRNNAGTVTYDTARACSIWPIVSHIDDGVGGGGLAANPVRGFM